MTFLSTAKAKLSVLIVTFALLSVAHAQRRDKKTDLTVSETIEVPGATLTPGKYVVKLVDSQSNRHIVRFLNEDETEVLATVLAIPNQRLEPTGDTTFSFYETPAGNAPALRAWFYPGDTFGQEFAYPKDRAQQLSQQTNTEVPSVPDDVDMTAAAGQQAQRETESNTAASNTPATPRTAPAPPQRTQTEREAVARQPVRESEPTTLAQAEPPRPAPAARPAPQQRQQPATTDQEPSRVETRDRLPDTASPAPLFGLIGFGCFAAALGLRRVIAR